MIPAAVIVILNGAIVASAPPAQLLFGQVMAPLAPVVTRFTDRAVLDGDTISLARGGRTCVLHIGSDTMRCDGVPIALPAAPFGRGGVAYVPLGDVARAFGGTATYDARARIATVAVDRPADLRTPAPFDPLTPQAAPTVIFTPSPVPVPPTPHPLDTGSPQPRRTAIPVDPSRVPPDVATTPRP